MNNSAIDIVKAKRAVAMRNVETLNDQITKIVHAHVLCSALPDDLSEDDMTVVQLEQITSSIGEDYCFESKAEVLESLEEGIADIAIKAVSGVVEFCANVFISLPPSSGSSRSKEDKEEERAHLESIHWDQSEHIRELPMNAAYTSDLRQESVKLKGWLDATIESYPEIKPLTVCGKTVTVELKESYDGSLEAILTPDKNYHRNAAHLTTIEFVDTNKSRDKSTVKMFNGKIAKKFSKVLTTTLETLKKEKDIKKTQALLVLIGKVVPFYHMNMIANLEHYETMSDYKKV